MIRQYSPVKEQLLARRELFGVEKGQGETLSPLSIEGPTILHHQQQQHRASDAAPQLHGGAPEKDEEERLLDEEELEDELVQRSPTIRLEREKDYQATLQLRQDIETGKKLQERGDGEGMPKFPIKHTGLEMPPDWVFEDFMAQRVPIGMVSGFTND